MPKNKRDKIRQNKHYRTNSEIKHSEQEKEREQQSRVEKGEHSQNQDEQLCEQQGQEQFSNKGNWKIISKPQKQLKLFMIDFNQCDSKKCTGRKMERFGLLKSIKEKEKKKKFRGIVLSAFGDQPVSIQDMEICLKYGICVIDCSWNRINETDSFRFKNQRILPYVVAGNPVNYGKPYQLSCAEALATALCTVGYTPQAQYIMSKFGWADGFWSINEQIKDYGACSNLDELREMSSEIQNGTGMKQQREYIMPSSSQSQQDDLQEEQENENEIKNENQLIQKEQQQKIKEKLEE